MKSTHPIFKISKGSRGTSVYEGPVPGPSGLQRSTKIFGGFSSSPKQSYHPTKEDLCVQEEEDFLGEGGQVTKFATLIQKQPRGGRTLIDLEDLVDGGWTPNCRRWPVPSTSSAAACALGQPRRFEQEGRRIYPGLKVPTRLKRQAGPMPVVLSPKRQRQEESESGSGCCGWNRRICRRPGFGGTKRKLSNAWNVIMRKKRDCDLWNPNKANLCIACIDESKLPGLKEAIKPNRGIFYRIFWLAMFLTMTIVGGVWSYHEFRFQKSSPVLHAFAIREITIRELPAFSINVTPHTAFKKSVLNKIIRKHKTTLKSPPKKISAFYKLLSTTSHICEPKTSHSTRQGLGFLNDYKLKEEQFLRLYGHMMMPKDDVNDDVLVNTVLPLMKKASHQCEDMIKYCTWNRKPDGCKFRPTFGTTGGGCSFNTMPPSDLYERRSFKTLWSEVESSTSGRAWKNWNLQKHLDHLNDPETGEILQGPLRQASGGWPWGVSFVVTMDDTDTACPQFESSGTRITVSVPGVDVDVERVHVIAPPNHEIFIRVFPELTLADEDIRSVAIEDRQCLMEGERNLTHYKVYNQENCYRECVAEHILQQCKCVLLSYPNSAGQRLCTVKNFHCVREKEEELIQGKGYKDACPKCLPTCSHMTLRLETTMAPFSNIHLSDMTQNINESSAVVHSFIEPKTITAKARKLRHSKYEIYSEIGSIYETTNDMSGMGYVKVFCAIIMALAAYLTKRCCQNRNVNVFGLKQRVDEYVRKHRLRRRASKIHRDDLEAGHDEVNNGPTPMDVHAPDDAQLSTNSVVVLVNERPSRRPNTTRF